MRRQLAWLTEAGYRHIVIIDNNSTYEPLWAFYASLEGRITVIKLDQNYGKTALWDAGILDQLGIEGPFVYTDSDIVPDDCCPADLVRHLLSILDQHPQICKAGPALKLDDLPDHYRHKAKALLAWEQQFWRRPAARGVFIADIDTTFARLPTKIAVLSRAERADRMAVYRAARGVVRGFRQPERRRAVLCRNGSRHSLDP